jgi:hypothetical protein
LQGEGGVLEPVSPEGRVPAVVDDDPRTGTRLAGENLDETRRMRLEPGVAGSLQKAASVSVPSSTGAELPLAATLGRAAGAAGPALRSALPQAARSPLAIKARTMTFMRFPRTLDPRRRCRVTRVERLFYLLL